MNIRSSIASIEDIESCHRIDDSFERGFKTDDLVFKNAIKNKHLLVSKNDEGIINGYLMFTSFWPDLPFIQMIRKDMKISDKGVGRSLITLMIDICNENKWEFLLSSTDIENKGSQIFHEKLGFEKLNGVELIPGEPIEVFYRLTIQM